MYEKFHHPPPAPSAFLLSILPSHLPVASLSPLSSPRRLSLSLPYLFLSTQSPSLFSLVAGGARPCVAARSGAAGRRGQGPGGMRPPAECAPLPGKSSPGGRTSPGRPRPSPAGSPSAVAAPLPGGGRPPAAAPLPGREPLHGGRASPRRPRPPRRREAPAAAPLPAGRPPVAAPLPSSRRTPAVALLPTGGHGGRRGRPRERRPLPTAIRRAAGRAGFFFVSYNELCWRTSLSTRQRKTHL